MQHQTQHQGQQQARQTGSSAEGTAQNRSMTPTASASGPSRNQHSEESWIEIESRPSSSSLSSAADEIITTGLRVQHDSNLHRRRRRSRSTGQFRIGTGYRVTSAGGGNSSQEEYDESESESDRVMTSSNEGIGPSPLQNELPQPPRSPYSVASSETMSEREGDDEDEDDDENATAVNYPRSSRRQFEPRPNAFSHPPTQHAVRTQSGTVYTPRRPAARSSSQRHSYPQHTPFNAVSPQHQADHDEALRASLSTLLSAAAAVRGLPKPGHSRTVTSNTSGRIDPTSLRIVPESVALGEIPEDASSHQVSSGGPPTSSSPRTASSSPSEKSKRKASPPANAANRSSSKDRRAVKKARRMGPLVDDISPTLLTWVVSAGVVVLMSALSFSAGYVVGKEAGHAEAMGQIGAVGSEAGRCSKEAATGLKGAGLGLRRLRWSGGSGVRV
ncbi:hypothetical protein BU26DRAFT_222683 [Trematosphaeria pertusa]|uniref:REJ domain-containing protein n=1 Tax=Trematosphaeria pertusa TaxID=390896 RepID=A0A6A6IT04_9PLEO|nr:uncharacterized protein BU26DRAFT_222683 [Trematosphaeria pertusa]KAF2253429.1 hypothetical protein BU26DRAFT_222683 [Trematosphaeria pertusa]